MKTLSCDWTDCTATRSARGKIAPWILLGSYGDDEGERDQHFCPAHAVDAIKLVQEAIDKAHPITGARPAPQDVKPPQL